MGEKWRSICVSSSISNFEGNLRRRYSNYGVWSWRRTYNPTIFFGMYTPVDYLKLLLHFGRKKVFWCGSDILKLSGIWRVLIATSRATHYCENVVEAKQLERLGIYAEVWPMLFDDPDAYPITFIPDYLQKRDKHIRVFLCAHKGREFEYGVDVVQKIAPLLPNITFHIFGVDGNSTANVKFMGHVTSAIFDAMIDLCHAGLRLNAFDGFSEVVAKSILKGQYPISLISYPRIDQVSDEKALINKLKMLQSKQEPNYKARDFWYQILCKKIEA